MLGGRKLFWNGFEMTFIFLVHKTVHLGFYLFFSLVIPGTVVVLFYLHIESVEMSKKIVLCERSLFMCKPIVKVL